MIRPGHIRYVRRADVDRYHRAGWMIAATLGPVHGDWSVLMWRCGCFGEGAQ